MEQHLNKRGKYGWMALGAGILAWDVIAEDTLTASFSRGMENRYTKPLVVSALGVTAAHLLGIIPEQYDPFCLSIGYLRELVQQVEDIPEL